MYHGSYGNDPRSLIFLIGLFPCLISFRSMFMVHLIKSVSGKNKEIYYNIYMVLSYFYYVFVSFAKMLQEISINLSLIYVTFRIHLAQNKC
jgi:hypothetical protein